MNFEVQMISPFGNISKTVNDQMKMLFLSSLERTVKQILQNNGK